MTEKPKIDRVEKIADGIDEPVLTTEQITRLRDAFVAKGVPLERGNDVFDHFTPQELTELLSAIYDEPDDSDEANPEHVRLFAKLTFLIHQLPDKSDEIPFGAHYDIGGEVSPEERVQLDEDWERLQAALKKEGLLQPNEDKK